ncbi:hypothetical protein [Streptomyces sp. NPDC048295]|uniref:hypothetical protein n=1 Tax=Streptomyces sp. NPDC048295 TaxID=3154617 RepID=UPI0034470B64
MLRTIKAAGVAAAAALALAGAAVTPATAAPAPSAASARALQTGGYLDCDMFVAEAWGRGYPPGMTIVVRHLGDWQVTQDTLVVGADGTWSVEKAHYSGWDYTVEVRDTQDNVLDSKFIGQCGIWG